MVAAVPLKYNFYHSDGSGRDGFIRNVSEHQTSFNYVPKSPELPGTRQPGMASNTVGISHLPSYTEKPFAVTGYTGLRQTAGEMPTSADAFPGLPKDGVTPHPMNSLLASFHEEKRRHEARIQTPSYRMPSYAGHCSGHQHVCGFTHGAVCWGDAGPTTFATIGEGAPGLGAKVQLIKSVNIPPDAKVPAGLPRTKTGYMGHLPGKHHSSNFGKNFATAAEEWIASDGKPALGGIADPVQPFNADTDCKVQYPTGHIERPWRQRLAVSGYAGFRPRTTPAVL